MDQQTQQWEPYQVPTAKLEPSIDVISPVMDLHGWKKALWKADQLTLASEGSEYAYSYVLYIAGAIK